MNECIFNYCLSLTVFNLTRISNNYLGACLYYTKFKMSRRDDFSKKTIELLARRAGGKCAICSCATWGPNDKPYSSTNIGQAAHIAAAAEGGPRYDWNMTPEDRCSVKNGIWLCSNCHDKVDRNVETYSVQELRKLKAGAESRARKDLGVSHATAIPSANKREELAHSISGIAIVEIHKTKAKFTTLKVNLEEAKEILTSINFIDINRGEYYLPEVGKEMIHLFFGLVGYNNNASIHLEVIRHVSDIAHKYHSTWGTAEVTDVCELLKTIIKGFSPRSTVFQSAIALLKDVIHLLKKSDASVSKVATDCLKSIQTMTKRVIKTRAAGVESVDFEEIKETPLKKRKLEDETNDIEEYLNKMAKLAGIEEVDSIEDEDLEEEIIEMGFEPNII